MSDEDDDSTEILARLKRLYKAAGIRYRDVARALGTSEATVKRLMNGRGLTLTTLNRLCSVADITLFELVALAQQEMAGSIPIVTLEQASALAGDMALSTVFFLIDKHWEVARIAREFAFDEAMMNRYLTRLDHIGVIALFPGNRIRLLRRMSKDLRYKLTGNDLAGSRMSAFLHNLDFPGAGMAWTSGIARLSPASFSHITELLDQFRDTIFSLGERDLDLSADQVSWHLMFAGVRPVSTEELLDPPVARDR